MNSKKLLLLSIAGISLAAQLNAYHGYNNGLDDDAAFQQAIKISMQQTHKPAVSHQSNLTPASSIASQKDALNGKYYNGSYQSMMAQDKQDYKLAKFVSKQNATLVTPAVNHAKYVTESVSSPKPVSSTMLARNVEPRMSTNSSNVSKENTIAPHDVLDLQNRMFKVAGQGSTALNQFNNTVPQHRTSSQIDKINNDALKMGIMASLLPASPRSTIVSPSFAKPSASAARTAPSMISQKSNVSPSSVYSTMKTLTPSFKNPVNQFNAIMKTGSVSRLTNYSVPTLAPKAVNNFAGISYQSNIRPSLALQNRSNLFNDGNRFSYQASIKRQPSLFTNNYGANRVRLLTTANKLVNNLKGLNNGLASRSIVKSTGITADQLKGLNMRTGRLPVNSVTPLRLVPKL